MCVCCDLDPPDWQLLPGVTSQLRRPQGSPLRFLPFKAWASFYLNHVGLKQKPSPTFSEARLQSPCLISEPFPGTPWELNRKDPPSAGKNYRKKLHSKRWPGCKRIPSTSW